MSFAATVDARIKAATTHQIRLGRVVSAAPPSPDAPGRVWVSGIAEQPVPCDWSATFQAEMSAVGANLTGRTVEVHIIDGQNIVAYTITIGDK